MNTTTIFYKSRAEARKHGSVKDMGKDSPKGQRWAVVSKDVAQTTVEQEPIVMYKLVTQEMTTQNNTKWEIGVTNKAKHEGIEMCSNQVLHCYADHRLAVIFNPIHANINNPVMMKIHCSPIINTDGLKHACKEQTPVEIIQVPKITTTQRVAFAIKCALIVYKAVDFVNWATKWLSGEDRNAAAARAAAYAADAAAYAADAAAYVAYAAAYAADAAAYVAYAAAYAADAAAYAARAAADAAAYAAYAAALPTIAKTFVEIIDWVMDNIE